MSAIRVAVRGVFRGRARAGWSHQCSRRMLQSWTAEWSREVNVTVASSNVRLSPNTGGRASPATAFQDMFQQPIRREKLLDGMNQSDLHDLMESGVKKRYRRGELVFRQGDPHRHTYVILQGVIRTSFISASGKEYTVAYWSDGDLVGGPYFIDTETDYLWSGYANGSTEVLALSPDALRTLAARVPSLAVALIDAMASKLHWFSLLLQGMGTQSAEGRLSVLLLSLSNVYGINRPDGVLIRHAFTQTDLGRMVGVSRQWVNTALGRLQKENAISVVRGRFLIRDRTKLSHHVG